jgi:triosephosphate isomerase
MNPDRRPLISGNWKMHLNHFEALQLVQKLSYAIADDVFAAADVAVHPPFTDIRTVQTAIEADRMDLILGAQHCHSEQKGAFTGEVSALMLAKLNVRYVIAGHSERRQVFSETDDDVAKKVKAILAAEMTPIMCCGETLDEREAGQTEEKVEGQIRAGLAGLKGDVVGGLVVAYEPIWAIGTGRTATPDDAQTVCARIRSVVGEIAGTGAAAAVRIQYGGSVKAATAGDLLRQADIDGLLVGGASLDPEEFSRIAASAQPG